VTAVRVWLQAAGITSGWLFRSIRKGGKALGGSLWAQEVANIVKAQASPSPSAPPQPAGGWPPGATAARVIALAH